jgi:flagellin
MALVVNTNIASLNAQRNLDKSGMLLAKALERLSSGLRVNSAADDAAGLAISDKMFAQIRGTNQGIRNANDGISLSQTTEGALSEYTSALQRMRELAVQSSNATNSSTDRSAIDNEYKALLAEMDRIATQTTFNGNQVLNGTLGTLNFQVGPNVGDTISLGLSTSVRTNALGQIAEQTSPDAAGVDSSAIAGSQVSINGTFIQVSAAGAGAGQTADSAWSKVEAIKASGIAGVTATAVATTATSTAFANGASEVYNANAGAKTYSLTVNGSTIYNATSLAATTGLTATQIAAQVNLFSGTTGVSGSVNGTNHLVLTAADGRNIVITQDSSHATDVTSSILTAGGAAVAVDTGGAVNTADFTNRGKITLSSSSNVTLGGTVARLGFTGVAAIALDTTTMSTTDVLTVANAGTAIKRLDASLSSVSTLRSTLGAIQNRMQSTIANLASVVQNVTEARGRILDADFAAETAQLTKANILREAGTTILAQANSVPQQALTLLRG